MTLVIKVSEAVKCRSFLMRTIVLKLIANWLIKYKAGLHWRGRGMAETQVVPESNSWTFDKKT